MKLIIWLVGLRSSEGLRSICWPHTGGELECFGRHLDSSPTFLCRIPRPLQEQPAWMVLIQEKPPVAPRPAQEFTRKLRSCVVSLSFMWVWATLQYLSKQISSEKTQQHHPPGVRDIKARWEQFCVLSRCHQRDFCFSVSARQKIGAQQPEETRRGQEIQKPRNRFHFLLSNLSLFSLKKKRKILKDWKRQQMM